MRNLLLAALAALGLAACDRTVESDELRDEARESGPLDEGAEEDKLGDDEIIDEK